MVHDLKELLPLPTYDMFDTGDGSIALVATYPGGPVRRITIEVDKGAAKEVFLLQKHNKKMWDRLYGELTWSLGTLMATCKDSRFGKLPMVVSEFFLFVKKLDARLASQRSTTPKDSI